MERVVTRLFHNSSGAIEHLFRGLCWLVCVGSVVTGCASQVVGYPGDGSTNQQDGTTDTRRPGTDTGPEVIFRDVPIEFDVFREDTCPNSEGGRTMEYECDPWRPLDSCAAGTACYPYIEYPSGVCESEIYRAECFASGTVMVDRFCTSGSDCAPGLSCFVTGAGNRCLQLCNLNGGAPECPRGQICEPTDLPDFGACD